MAAENKESYIFQLLGAKSACYAGVYDNKCFARIHSHFVRVISTSVTLPDLHKSKTATTYHGNCMPPPVEIIFE